MSPVWRERLLLLTVLLLTVLAVDPRGDFPLNDDWNFALTTWKFADSGELQYSRFTAMTLKTQVMWGAAWTFLLGKNFAVLRLSTLVLWLGAAFLMDGWLRRLRIASRIRWLAVLAFAFHPIVLWSAFTYMTQVPFLFCSIAALSSFHKGLSEDQDGMLWVGGAFVVAAYLIRQTGVALSLAPLAVLLWRRNELTASWKKKGLIVATPLLLFVAFFVFTDVLEGYPGQIGEHFVVWKVSAAQLPMRVTKVVGLYALFNLQNCGLFFAALVVLGAVGGMVSSSRSTLAVWITSSLLCLGGAAAMILEGFPMPYWSKLPRLDVHPGNIFVNLGLGPLTLRDTWTLDMEPPFALTSGPRVFLTYGAAVLGAGVLAILVSAWFRAREAEVARRTAIELVVVHSIAASVALFPSGIYFDRYCVDSLWSFALLVPVLVPALSVKKLLPVALVLGMSMTFGILATKEYIEWNRVRWHAYDEMRAEGIELRQMDGGYEINQYLIGSFDGPILLNKSGFSVVDDEYVISFNRIPGYRVHRSYSLSSFLGFRKGAIHVLKRVQERSIE